MTNTTSLLLMLTGTLSAQEDLQSILKNSKPAPKGWPSSVVELEYPSSADNTSQPALFFKPETETPVPLLVGLHTWSGDYRQQGSIPYGNWCVEKNWAFIHPNFRGPNRHPKACGSEHVVKDIVSAVEFAKSAANVDIKRIYLVGVSGGGYGSLLMAGRAPEIWAGVSAWASISDLRAWHEECKVKGRMYFKDIESSCGGPPNTNAEIDKEYLERSAITYLKDAQGLPLQICTGIHDGHKGSVPVSHTLLAFNEVAEEKDRLTREQIAYFVNNRKVPQELQTDIQDLDFGAKPPLFRRSSGKAHVTIFEGGHEIISNAALKWLEKQKKE
ncbi:MAG: prolyl oligopeptidase family serine peptidase [Planctomycetota bacterium]|nr:prolyl oligopeptidase family serine peptidase [Planctomycetota bacterium]MDA1137228.1 prolyl oligopeptidase family serine peptidase [Planctomycetota bacterium]